MSEFAASTGIGLQSASAQRTAGRIGLLDAEPASSRLAPILATIGAGSVHAIAFGVAALVGMQANASTDTTVPVTELFDVELPVQEDPVPAPEPELPAPPIARVSKPREPAAIPEPAPPDATQEAPPPAAAQAAEALTADDESIDFGETLVVGTGAVHAGGVTESEGTATQAVRDPGARAGGVEGGTGNDLKGDRSRMPQLAGGAEWDCPFPEEADDAGIDHAVVTLRIEVNGVGSVMNIRTTNDPGNGFAREARLCAENKHWSPGLDRAGNPVSAVALVNVRFDR